MGLQGNTVFVQQNKKQGRPRKNNHNIITTKLKKYLNSLTIKKFIINLFNHYILNIKLFSLF